MKFSLLTPVFLLISAAAVKADDPSAVLSSFYTNPPTVTGAQLTSLASALESVATSWEDSPIYTSVAYAIIAAAPTSVQASIASHGWSYESLTKQPWWTGVPDSAKSAVSSEQAALQSVANKVLSTSSSKAGAAQATGVPFAAGMAGVIGAIGIMAVL